MALVVAKLEDRGLDHEAVDALDEAPPIGAAAEFAVGDDLEPDLLLHLHHVADAGVLDLREFGIVDSLAHVIAKRLTQGLRAQQASHMIGTEWRAALWFLDHRRSPGRFFIL